MSGHAERLAHLCVQRGVSFLDNEDAKNGEKTPWYDRISVDKIDIADANFCVLGQLFRNYQVGVERLGLKNQTVENGFHPSSTGILTFDHLTAAWKQAVRARQTKLLASA